MARTYRALAALISYPTEALQAATGEIAAVLAEEGLGRPHRNAPPSRDLLAELAGRDIYDLQERYFALFDRSRTLSLHLFEHVHGESRDRGQAMADLIELYRGHGFEPTAGELPDFLPLFLEFLSLLPDVEARALLAEPAGILRSSRTGLSHAKAPMRRCSRRSPRWPTHRRSAVPISSAEDPDDLVALDAAWEEAAVHFGPANRSTVAEPIACGPGFAPPPATPRPSEEIGHDERLSEQRALWLVSVCGLTVFALGSLVRFDPRNTPGAAGRASCCGAASCAGAPTCFMSASWSSSAAISSAS